MAAPQSNTPSEIFHPPKCSERGCPFPPIPGHDFCSRHSAMFEGTLESIGDEEPSGELPPSQIPGELLVAGLQPRLPDLVTRRNPSAEGLSEHRGMRYFWQPAAVWDHEGRCTRCGGSRDRANKRCSQCLAEIKKLLEQCRAVGRCLDCKSRPARRSMTTCEACSNRRARRLRLWRRKLRGLPLSGALYNSKQVAKIVGVDADTVSRWVRQGKIKPPALRGPARGFYWTQQDVDAVREYKGRFYHKTPGRKTVSRSTILARAREYKLRIVNLRRSLGQCIQCGAKVEISGRCFCLKCRTNFNASRRARREAKFRNSRICQPCGKRPAVEGKASCADCLQKAKERATLRYRLRKRAGLCIYCGGQRDARGMLKCSACSENSNKRRNELRKRQRVSAARGGGIGGRKK